MGRNNIGTIIPMIPDQPSRIIKIIVTPIKINGIIKVLKNIEFFASIMLKSFESIFTIFEVYEFFIVYCEIEVSFAKSIEIKPVFILAPMIGAW